MGNHRRALSEVTAARHSLFVYVEEAALPVVVDGVVAQVLDSDEPGIRPLDQRDHEPALAFLHLLYADTSVRQERTRRCLLGTHQGLLA